MAIDDRKIRIYHCSYIKETIIICLLYVSKKKCISIHLFTALRYNGQDVIDVPRE